MAAAPSSQRCSKYAWASIVQHPLFTPDAFRGVFVESSLFQWKEIDARLKTKWTKDFTGWAIDQMAAPERGTDEFLRRFYQLHSVKNLTLEQREALVERAIYCGEMVVRLEKKAGPEWPYYAPPFRLSFPAVRKDPERLFIEKNLDSINREATESLAHLLADRRKVFDRKFIDEEGFLPAITSAVSYERITRRIHCILGNSTSLPWGDRLDAVSLAWEGLLCGSQPVLFWLLKEENYWVEEKLPDSRSVPTRRGIKKMPDEMVSLIPKQIDWSQCTDEELIQGAHWLIRRSNRDASGLAFVLQEGLKRESLRTQIAFCGIGEEDLSPPDNIRRHVPLVWVFDAVFSNYIGCVGSVHALLRSGLEAGLADYLQREEDPKGVKKMITYLIRKALFRNNDVDIGYALAKLPFPQLLMHDSNLAPIFIHAAKENDIAFIEAVIQLGKVREVLLRSEVEEAIAQARTAGHELLANRLTECLAQKGDGIDPALQTPLARVKILGSFIDSNSREKAEELLPFLLQPEHRLHEAMLDDPGVGELLSSAFERATAKDWFFLIDPLLAWGFEKDWVLRSDLWRKETLNKIFCRLLEQEKLDELAFFIEEADAGFIWNDEMNEVVGGGGSGIISLPETFI